MHFYKGAYIKFDLESAKSHIGDDDKLLINTWSYMLKPQCAMAVIGYDLDRGGPKDSENAPNSFLTKTKQREGVLTFWY